MIARSGAAREPAACASHHRFPALTHRASRLTAGLVAAGVLAACSAHPAGAAGSVITVSTGACGRWQAAPGLRTFRIHNEASAAAEVYLVNPKTYAIYGALDGIGAGTTSTMAVSLGSGTYAFRCVIDDIDPFSGPAVKVPGHVKGEPGIVPVTNNDMLAPSMVYHAYVTVGLRATRDPDRQAGRGRPARRPGRRPRRTG